MNRHLVTIFNGFADFINIREINLRIDPLGIEIQAQSNQIDITGALPIAEKTPLNAVSTRQIS